MARGLLALALCVMAARCPPQRAHPAAPPASPWPSQPKNSGSRTAALSGGVSQQCFSRPPTPTCPSCTLHTTRISEARSQPMKDVDTRTTTSAHNHSDRPAAHESATLPADCPRDQAAHHTAQLAHTHTRALRRAAAQPTRPPATSRASAQATANREHTQQLCQQMAAAQQLCTLLLPQGLTATSNARTTLKSDSSAPALGEDQITHDIAKKNTRAPPNASFSLLHPKKL